MHFTHLLFASSALLVIPSLAEQKPQPYFSAPIQWDAAAQMCVRNETQEAIPGNDSPCGIFYEELTNCVESADSVKDEKECICKESSDKIWPEHEKCYQCYADQKGWTEEHLDVGEHIATVSSSYCAAKQTEVFEAFNAKFTDDAVPEKNIAPKSIGFDSSMFFGLVATGMIAVGLL